MAYTAEFATQNDDKIKIEIIGAGDGTLTLSGNRPVVIEYESDDIFKPLKQSSCTISVITNKPLFNFYTGSLNDVTCKVYSKAKGSSTYTQIWYGFLTPNVYSSDYNAGYNIFELEFIDVIAQLDNIKFQRNTTEITINEWWKDENGTWHLSKAPDGFVPITNIFDEGFNFIAGTTSVQAKHFMTFLEIFKDAFNYIDELKVIKSIFILNNAEVAISALGVNSRNFIDESGDEEDGSMTYKEVFESIVSYMGMSMFFYGDSLYIVHPQTIRGAKFTELLINGKSNNNVSTSLQYLKNIGVNKAQASISLGDIFNKITIIGSNNPVGNIIPDPLEDSDLEVLTNYNSLPYVTEAYKIRKENEDNNYALLSSFSRNKRWKRPSLGYGSTNGTDYVNRKLNCVIQRYTSYSADEPEPSSLDWKSCVSWRFADEFYFGGLLSLESYVRSYVNPFTYSTLENAEGTNYFIGKGGYLIIYFEYKLGESNWQKENSKHNFIQSGTNEWYEAPEPYGHPHDCVEHNPYDYNWGVGKVATNENQWTWNSYKELYPFYIREDSIIEYHNIKFSIGNKAWDGTQWITKTNDYTGFKATTTLTYDDQIVGPVKKCDNSVSYKLGIAEPMDGILIPLPENEMLVGDIEFSIEPCNAFGMKFGCDNGKVPNNMIHYGRFFLVDSEFITKLNIVYTTTDSVKDIFNLETYDPDVVYTNEINKSNIVEHDDIELTTNTYSPYATSYSYVLRQLDNGSYAYVEKINGKKQEERIIEKYADYYSSPKIQYSNNLNNKFNTSITPLSTIYIESLGKTMVMDSGSYDLRENRVKVNLKEI